MKIAIEVCFLFVITFFLFSFSSPSNPLICREDHDHQICILRIKRSAKNYWEYRTVVSIDGQKRPIETYNCREFWVVRSDGTRVSFGNIDPINLVCSFFEN